MKTRMLQLLHYCSSLSTVHHHDCHLGRFLHQSSILPYGVRSCQHEHKNEMYCKITSHVENKEICMYVLVQNRHMPLTSNYSSHESVTFSYISIN